MIALADVEERLALFAEGICGRYLHIRKSGEDELPHQSIDALLLPETLDAEAPQAYHVLALQQIGQRECGTFDFSIERARELILLDVWPDDRPTRDSDLTRFFQTFPKPSAARQLFHAIEAVRINAHLRRTYPGAIKYMPPDALRDELDVAGTPIALPEIAAASATVYEVAQATAQLYPLLSLDLTVDAVLAEEASGIEWMQREARLEDWEQEEDAMSNQLLAVEMLESEDLEAVTGETDAGEVREEPLDIAALEQERDQLKRRIDMERALLRHRKGEPRPGARSYRYDEWDHTHRRYLKRHCTLFEERIEPDPEADLDAQRELVRAWIRAVKPQLEQIRPAGLQRMKRKLDGDELDLNAVIEARQDIRAGISPDERTYTRRERVHRDVCAVFLVDLSASTDDPIDPLPPPELDEWGDPVNLRDPFEDHPMFADLEPPSEETPRKIIDVQRDAMLVMASALDLLGDSFGIYGFSGYGHDNVEVFVAKDIDDRFSATSQRAIAAMKPKRSTRMGPAIRHSCSKLVASGHALRVLIVVSDGFPQDCDYGPNRGDHEYGLMDTAKALQEAATKGIETFCITVDRSGHDYLRRMCPEARYLVIEEMEDLPAALSKVYSVLTTR